MFGLSFWEIGVILVVALIALGPKRLPQLLKSVGRGMREVRRASNELRDALEEPMEELRKPLEEIRDGINESVRDAEREIEAAANDDDDMPVKRLQTKAEAMAAIDSAVANNSPNAIGGAATEGEPEEDDTTIDPYVAAAEAEADDDDDYGSDDQDGPDRLDADQGGADQIDDETVEYRDERFAQSLNESADDGVSTADDSLGDDKKTAAPQKHDASESNA